MYGDFVMIIVVFFVMLKVLLGIYSVEMYVKREIWFFVFLLLFRNVIFEFLGYVVIFIKSVLRFCIGVIVRFRLGC